MTAPVVEIRSGPLTLGILPSLGAGITHFTLDREGAEPFHLMRPAPAAPPGFNKLACYMMAPWVNRIAAARFAWQGRTIHLDPDWPDGTAIHGAFKAAPFAILDRSPVSARFRAQAPANAWPWKCSAELRYELEDRRLIVSAKVINDDTTDCPASIGFHPYYLREPMGPGDTPHVQSNVVARYPLLDGLPTGDPIADDLTAAIAHGGQLPATPIDDLFVGNADGATIHWPLSNVRLTYRCSHHLGHTVVYAPLEKDGTPKTYFALEPQTAASNALNAADPAARGVASIAPGAALEVEWIIDVEAL